MLVPGIFCFVGAAIVFTIGMLIPQPSGNLKRWWRWRMRVGGAVGMIIGLVLIIAGATTD